MLYPAFESLRAARDPYSLPGFAPGMSEVLSEQGFPWFIFQN
jgi:hypothetical protein